MFILVLMIVYLYWLYNSHQISKEKTGITSEFLVFLLFGEGIICVPFLDFVSVTI